MPTICGREGTEQAYQDQIGMITRLDKLVAIWRRFTSKGDNRKWIVGTGIALFVALSGMHYLFFRILMAGIQN
jgi:hypothetical protein